MNELPDRIEQEAQQLICRGQDLLDRTHSVAEGILKRVSRVMADQAPQAQVTAREDFECCV